MEPAQLFEGTIVFVALIIGLHFVANRLKLPPSAALLVGGGALAFLPGAPTLTVNPELVLVIFLPPLLFDGAWSISVSRLRRHMAGIASLAVGAVVFTCAAVAVVAHALFPALPWAACAALGAIVAPPDAVSARAVLQHVTLPRRLQILLEGESLLNDASGLVLFRFAIAAGIAGTFSVAQALGTFVLLAAGGAVVGVALGLAWVKLVRRLGDEYLIITATALMGWAAYLLGEILHVSGVIAAVTAGLVISWHAHTVLSASTRMRGGSFWTVIIFLMEAAVFVLIGLSLRGVIERGGGLNVVIQTMGLPMLAILGTLVAARFAWVFGSEGLIRLARAAGIKRATPLGRGGATVLSWAGARGVVTLALALSVPEDFPGRDLILVTSFAVILGTVLVQGTTLGRVIAWCDPSDAGSEKPRLNMSAAEGRMAKAQFAVVEKLAHNADGELIHPQLLKKYKFRAEAVDDYVERVDHYKPLLDAHFDVVLAAVSAGRKELIRLHREGSIDDETLHELERDLDLEELSAISAKA